jgi:hypothetical protein
VTEQQLLRIARRRLAVLRHAEEITGNVSLTCRNCWSWRRGWNHNLPLAGAGPGHAFSTSRITLMAEEYGQAKFRSK